MTGPTELQRRFLAHVRKTFPDAVIVEDRHMKGIDEVKCQPWTEMPDSIPNSKGERTKLRRAD